jgi:DNA-binding beta-propeller fold protein YncE
MVASVALVFILGTGHALAVADLAQKPHAKGCIVEGGAPDCQAGRGLEGPAGVAVSPDGNNVYVVGGVRDIASSAIAIFDRDPQSGELSQKPDAAGCIAAKAGGGCGEGSGLVGARGIAVSPDGKSVYVGSGISDAVAIFDRNVETGALTQKPGTAACISLDGDDNAGHSCAPARGLDFAEGVVVSPDGKDVYVASIQSGAVTSFQRDAVTGALAQLPGEDGCISFRTLPECALGHGLFNVGALAISADGKSLYGGSGNNGIAILKRDPTTGKLSQDKSTAGCVSEEGRDCLAAPNVDAWTVAVTPDGGSVYGGALRSNPSIGLLDRDPVTGTLSRSTATCTSKSGQTCPAGTGLTGAVPVVAVGPDSTSVYAISLGVISIFDRNPETRALVQRPGAEGCISADGKDPGCLRGRSTGGAAALAFSPDGKNAYLAAEVSRAVDVFDRVAPDLQAPVISGFKLLPARIPARPKRIPNFAFSLSEPASVKIVIERLSAGRRVGKACKAPSRKLAGHRRCTRISAVETLSVAGGAGANQARFVPRLRKKRLPPGAYRATIGAEDEAGNPAQSRRARFKILAPKKRHRRAT